MNIGKIEDFREELLHSFKNKSLIPVVGSGLSCGAKACKGTVPSGSEYKDFMIQSIIEHMKPNEAEIKDIEALSFSKVCDLYEDDDNVPKSIRINYLKNNFMNVKLDDNRRKFLKINWPYIYTLNIDDAIEKNSKYKFTIISNKEVYDDIYNDNKCVIKLHGDIKDIISYKDSDCKIFSSSEYANSLIKNASLLNKLRCDFNDLNMLFLGCSLEDEIDLKTLSSLPVPSKNTDISKRFIFVYGKPNRLQLSTYKTYNITDVVCFDSYEDMYNNLYNIWKESTEINDNELEIYENIQFKKLQLKDKNNNDYFYQGKSLYDVKSHCINIPYFYIDRKCSDDIIKNLRQNKIHIIYGSRISGKSYILLNLYQKVLDRRRLYFDGRTRVNDKALEKIINLKKVLAIFDNGALTREQIDTLLCAASTINRNGSNFILTLNRNENDIFGLISLRIKQSKLFYNEVLKYEIKNKFTVEETKDINDALPPMNIPVFEKNKTIVDNLVNCAHIMKVKSRFSDNKIVYKNYKELALLIVLAIKKKIYTSDIVKFQFESEIEDALKKYPLYIEKISTDTIEKDAKDLSGTKYVVNAHYWLCRMLGIIALNKEHYRVIADAYLYIITKLIENAGRTPYRQYKACREYILFDTINRIFLNESKGQLPLIVFLYGEMHSILARDSHFLHQNAKCYLRYSFYTKDEKKKGNLLQDALKMSVIAAEMMKIEFEEKNNEKVLISLAHAQYTIASIRSELCITHKYTNIQEINDTVEAIHVALHSPYNVDDYKREYNSISSKSITQVVNDFYNPQGNMLAIDNNTQNELNEIFAIVRNIII